MGFAVVDRATRRPVHLLPSDRPRRSLLYRYPAAKGLGRRNAPEVCP
jgi:hypothetical protein